MQDLLLFHYLGPYYKCIALIFGWCRVAMCFTKMMKVVVQHILRVFGYRVLLYTDDFLLPPSPSTQPATPEDFAVARVRLTNLFSRLGIERHLKKGCWDGANKIDHLGEHVNTDAMKIYLTEENAERIRRLS